ncbi:MAG: hypothetical protein FK732_12295 [Asgard group archaeon]|nr:hypothetical protein [Asgard group archaeon]
MSKTIIIFIKLHIVNLFQKAIEIHEKVVQFLSAVVQDFPEDKIELKIESSKTPLELMNHILTGHYHSMQKAKSELSFKEFCSDTRGFVVILNKQHREYKEKHSEELSLEWYAPSQNKGIASIPWAIMRASTHALHHASQLIVFRQIYGLGKLNTPNEISWPHLSNLITELHYKQEPKSDDLIRI